MGQTLVEKLLSEKMGRPVSAGETVVVDVDFAALRKQDVGTIIASGERAADLAVRLEYAGFRCTVVDSPLEAVKTFQPGKVEVLANYSAFRDLKKELDR